MRCLAVLVVLLLALSSVMKSVDSMLPIHTASIRQQQERELLKQPQDKTREVWLLYKLEKCFCSSVHIIRTKSTKLLVLTLKERTSQLGPLTDAS